MSQNDAISTCGSLAKAGMCLPNAMPPQPMIPTLSFFDTLFPLLPEDITVLLLPKSIVQLHYRMLRKNLPVNHCHALALFCSIRRPAGAPG
jgi:hypothetical protein